MSKNHRSPLFYVGDKFKLVDQIKKIIPKKINQFIEPFVGGGSVFLNVKAKSYLLNDIDQNVVNLHKFLMKNSQNPEGFFVKIEKFIDKYKLSKSYKIDNIPNSLKAEFKKTYFAKFNKDGFLKLRKDFNKNKKDLSLLYLLLIYGFNRMLRFNKSGDYNLPVGNVDFNKNVEQALFDYFKITKQKKVQWYSTDYANFIYSLELGKSDFVYLDPPYLITASEYNKLWSEDQERQLLEVLDILDQKNIKFALSNVVFYKGKENTILTKWAKKYTIHPIQSNYISYHNNSIKTFSEVIITNYAQI